MLNLDSLRRAVAEVGEAVRRPRDLARRWHRRDSDSSFLVVLAVLLANAAFGLGAYGLTMRMHLGAGGMLEGLLLTPLAAALAWGLTLPALFVGERLLGRTIQFRTAVLTAAIAFSFGSSALLASVPVNWFFTAFVPSELTHLAINTVVFAGIGYCMWDVFVRVTDALYEQPPGLYSRLWLVLTATIGFQLFFQFGLLDF